MYPSCDVAGRSDNPFEFLLPPYLPTDAISSTEEATASSIGDSKRDPLLEVDAVTERSSNIGVPFVTKDNLERGRLELGPAVETLLWPSSSESLEFRCCRTLPPAARDRLPKPETIRRPRLFVEVSLIDSSPLAVSLCLNFEKMAFISSRLARVAAVSV